MRYQFFALTIISAITVFCLLLAPPASAEVDSLSTVGSEPSVLSLDQCLQIGLEQNISLMRTRIAVELSYLDHVRNLAVFDPGFQLDLTTQHSEAPDNSTSGSSAKYDLGLSYVRPDWSGGRWSFSFDQTRSDGSSTVGDTATNYTSYSSQVGVGYALPILEGYGDRVNRIGLEKSDLGLRRSEAGVSEAERNLRFAIIQAYVNSVLAWKQIDIARLSLDTAQNLVNEVQARIDVGQLAPYELLSAQAGLAERQENLIRAENTYKIALDSLKEIIGLPLTDEIEINTGTLHPLYVELEPDDLFMTAQRNRPDLLDLDLRVQQAQLDQVLATDRRQSSLTWNTVLGLAGQDDDYGSSIANLRQFTWYTGIQYNLPLGGNRAAEADVTASQLQLNQLGLERTDFLRGLERDIRSALDDLQTALLRIDVTAQGLQVQETKMQNEHLRYELGLITSHDLLEFDIELANARLAYDNALADVLLSLARLELLTNQNLLSDAVALQNILTGEGASGE